jgi:hypothetical protein
MLLEVWLALFLAGILLSVAAFAVRTASLYAALLNLVVWSVVALGSLNIEVVSNGSVSTFEAPAVALVAAVQAAISLPVIYLAAVGRWSDDGSEGLDSAGGLQQTNPQR